jgi:hypothetical protein
MNDNKELAINALVISIQNDLRRGYKKDELLMRLSRIIDMDLMNSVKKRL